MVMEDVDLGKDRTHLIDFIYGKKEESESVSPSLDKSIPLTEEGEKKPKTSRKATSRVSCSSGLCLFLVLLSLFAIIGAAYLGHLATKNEYETRMVQSPTSSSSSSTSPVMCRNFSRPLKKSHRPVVKDEDDDENDALNQPTKADLALPTNISPVWYKVSLSPTPENAETSGVALVKLNVTDDTNRIILNANGIKFSEKLEKIQISREETGLAGRVKRNENQNETSAEASELSSADLKAIENSPELIDTGVKVIGIEIIDNLEKAVITLDSPLKKGSQVIVKIPFVTKSTNNNGLKKYSYKTGNETKSIFTTQLNYDYKRHIFPSFDQESFKAPASLKLLHKKGSIIIANSPVTTENDGDSLMSTLESSFDPDFVIGDFVAQNNKTSSGIEVNIWTRPEVSDKASLTLQYAIDALDDLEHLLQSRLKTKKLDIIAVPDYETGNRVSPSFIVLPEDRILLNPSTADIVQKVRAARTLSNRISAQWFGEATYAKEHGSFWLNNALPKYLEIEALERSLNVDSDDLWTVELEDILNEDATVTSRPLKLKHYFKNDDAEDIFSSFVARKGAAILRMIEKSIDKDNFKKGIRNFVSTHRNSSPSDDELWKSLQNSIDDRILGWNGEVLNIEKFVNTWIDQSGFPLVSIDKLDKENVEISQKRFRNDEETVENIEYHNAKYWFNWEIPLFLSSDSESESFKNITWLHEAFRLPLTLSNEILINTDSNGFYRVDYREKHWNQIAQKLQQNHKVFGDKTRARFISDSFALANTGQISFETALNVTNYLPAETSVVPWIIAVDNFKMLAERFEGTNLEVNFTKLVFSRISDEFDRITRETSKNEYLESVLQSKIFDLMSLIKPEKSNKILGEMFENEFLAHCQSSTNYSSQCSKVESELRSQVYCNGVEFGNDQIFALIEEFAEKETDNKEKNDLINSLACFREPRRLRELLMKSLNTTSRITQLLDKMNSRPVGKEIATNFIIDNWTVLKKKFKNDHETLNQIVQAGIVIPNERVKNTIEHFIDRHHKSTNQIDSLKRKLEEGTTQIYWRRQQKDELQNYLDGKMRGPIEDEASIDDISEEQ